MSNTKTKTFQEYIKTRKKFYIALYQRDFVWDSKKIGIFIDEIIESFIEHERGEKNRIFCGTIYLKNAGDVEKGWEVIDGQQRTTFLYIFSKLTLEYIDDSIAYFKNLEMATIIDKQNLESLTSLKENIMNFQITIEREKKKINEKIEKRDNRIGKDYHFLKGYIEEDVYKDTLEGNISDLSKFILYFWNNLDIIEIDVMDKYQINDVFKSINSKGKKLSEWDIIRNEIYRTINPVDEKTKESLLDYIDQHFETIEKINIKKEEFIRAYLIHKNKEYVKKNELSSKFDDSIKNQIFTPNDFYDFVEDFVTNLDSIDKKVLEDDSVVNEFRWFYKIASEFKATQIKVFTLFCIFNWNNSKIPDEINPVLIKLFINFVIYVSINEHRGNIFEKFFQQNASKICNIKEEEIEEIIDETEFFSKNLSSLREMKPKIEENKELLKLYVWISTPKSLKNSLLKTLNHQYEHVLPKKFEEYWSSEKEWREIPAEEVRKKYLNKIGNIILINKILNLPISNKKFDFKYKRYIDNSATSTSHYFPQSYDVYEEINEFMKPLFIEKDIKWTPKTIETRTSDISEEICSKLEEIISNANDIIFSKTKKILKSKNDNDIMNELIKIIGNDEISLKQIYDKMYASFKDDINQKRWKSEYNFKAVIRRNIQENTKDSKNLKYPPLFERVKIGVYKKIKDS